MYITGIKVYVTIERTEPPSLFSAMDQLWRFQINQTIGNQSAVVDGDVIAQWKIPSPNSLGLFVDPTPFGTNHYVNLCKTTPRDKVWDKTYNRVLDTGWKSYKPKFTAGIINITGAPTFQYKHEVHEYWIPVKRTYELNNNGTVEGWRSWNFAIFGTWPDITVAPAFSLKCSMYYRSGGSS